MTRRVAATLLVLLAALAAVASAEAAPVQISTATSPQPAHFGDVTHAMITVRAATPAQVRGGFAPYEVLGSSSSSRRANGVATTTWRFELQCLEPECAPGAKPRRIALSPSRVLVGSQVLTARFAPIVVVPRTTTAQVAHPERSFLHPTVPPAPSYRYSPSATRALLFAAAAVLVLAALLLVWPLLRPRRARSQQPQPDALARALALVRAARSRPPPDRRRALGLLSRTLRRRGDAQDARAAAELAWSEPDPDSERMESLAEHVERTR